MPTEELTAAGHAAAHAATRKAARAQARSLRVRWRGGVALALVVWLGPLADGPALAADATAPADQAAPGLGGEAPSPAGPAEAAVPQPWNLFGQATFIKQYHPSFTSPYQGPNSLTPVGNGAQSADLTLFLGVRLWDGGALYFNPEIDQGFGLSDTLGVAGFPNGESAKVGRSEPYFRLQRAFVRQRFDLGGDATTLMPGANELGGTQTADNLTLTFGKLSAVDIFDTNSYAHDPRGDFLNWSVIDAAAYDYAADAWGYTVGAAAEWTQSWWTLRGGFFDLSDVPNSEHLEQGFKEFEVVGELEGRYQLAGHPGKAKLLGFLNYGRMGSYDDALRLAQATGTTPDTGQVRHYSTRPGVALNLEQELTPDLGAFARISFNRGSKEAYEFTDVNRSQLVGLSLKGGAWGRANDVVGLAAVANEISAAAQAYFAAGGLGILVGDGQLPHPGTEAIMETYYALHLTEDFVLSVDYQHVTNPAYNRDRGPASIFGLRLHLEF